MHPTAQKVVDAAHHLGLAIEIKECEGSTRTAEEAAHAVGCRVAQIVKSLLFIVGTQPTMVLVSGINRLDERKLANLAITVGERVAFAASVIHCAGTTTSGRSFDDRVRATFCLEKHDGAWRIAHQHVSIPAQDN
jgi:hypothetical protein